MFTTEVTKDGISQEVMHTMVKPHVKLPSVKHAKRVSKELNSLKKLGTMSLGLEVSVKEIVPLLMKED